MFSEGIVFTFLMRLRRPRGATLLSVRSGMISATWGWLRSMPQIGRRTDRVTRLWDLTSLRNEWAHALVVGDGIVGKI